eukprot:CAMPEP_0116067736 /NCGR_PEP_ID=MMETSP0322-20121206/11229_1 /TAXON_ID=163516 /ORGANISM="Leptocylindrus danicus var. apora, Strain B651" /LENGTH=350 /DNA_ID=CAMNT_0003554685 /DNA_START=139 /DNA_END=1192 /DNA_ORIENTATION=-
MSGESYHPDTKSSLPVEVTLANEAMEAVINDSSQLHKRGAAALDVTVENGMYSGAAAIVVPKQARIMPRKRPKSEKNERKWLEMFEALKVFKQKYGNCLVPNYCSENVKLGIWVKTQRYQYRLLNEGKPAKISNERIMLLNSVGFVWDVSKMIEEEHRKGWDRNLHRVKLFKLEHGHCNIPSKFEKGNNGLGAWMSRNRANYRLKQSGLRSSMTTSQAKRFEYLVYGIGDGENGDQENVDNAVLQPTETVQTSASLALDPAVLLSNPIDAEAARLLEASVATAATCAAASLLKFADNGSSQSQPVIEDNIQIEDDPSKLNKNDSSSESQSDPPALDAAQVSISKKDIVPV